MCDRYDCIILGGGLAGLTAAIYTARAGLSVAVIEKEQCGGQAVMADYVENYPGFVGSGYELVEKTEAQAIDSGAEIIYDEIESVELDGEVKKAVGFDGTYEAKALIIATGASHKKAGFARETELAGAGVSYCATCDGAFFDGKCVAVIGGANTAVSEALYLANICKKVYLIYRRDRLRADYTLVKRLESTENIEVIFNAVPIEVKGDGKVEKLVCKLAQDTTGELEVSGVFVAVGLTPATGLFAGKTALDENGYIKTNEVLETDIQGVYAVGDCRVKSLRQMVTAAADGAVAANQVIKSVVSL
jgi:thioredoxin reductase (NADPH)